MVRTQGRDMNTCDCLIKSLMMGKKVISVVHAKKKKERENTMKYERA